MPLLITFGGLPIKRRRQVKGGLLLIFYSSVAGLSGECRVVTDAEWRAHGRIAFLPAGQRPDVRQIAAQFSVLPS